MAPVLLNPSRFGGGGGGGGGGGAYAAAVLADAPACYLKLDETSGTVAVDASGNSRNGTYTPGITLGATSLLTDGSGKAAQFTANTSTGIIVPDAAWMDFTALAFECLVNFSSAVDGLNGDALISHYGGGGISALLWRTTAGKLGLQVKVAGTIINCNGTTTVVNGTKYHVAGKWDGSNAKILVGGIVENTVAASGSLATTSDDLRIGCYSNSASTVPGMIIDEPAVYDYAVSDARLAVHAAAA